LAVQLYSLRSRGNWGHGDFSDLASLIELVAALGGGGIGLNPLHALFYDRPGTGSPYSPNSRLFLNPLYIDVEAIEEFNSAQFAALDAEIERLRNAELIDYHAVAKTKLAALRGVYRTFTTQAHQDRRDDFAAYQRERGLELNWFAAFETLRNRFPGPWSTWPQEWRRPSADLVQRLQQTHGDDFGFHAFLQWQAERQLARCAKIAAAREMPVGLYLDTAVGIDPAGADAWMAQESVLSGLSIGAPPDHYNPAGQDWGLTSYNPHGLIANDFEPFRQMLRASMRYAGAVRIDHVLGLMRLFVIPYGASAKQGVYLRYPFTAMLAALADESRRCSCIAIGEDLGTVPENFRTTMASWGIWSYLVMLFERNGDGSFRDPRQYPECAIETFGTHDLPTFAGWISGHDLRVKRSIGVAAGETDEDRDRSRHALEAAVGHAPVTFENVTAFLAAAPTRLLSLSLEDVLGVLDQVNMPGTVAEYPNWRRRWPLTLEELATDQRLRRVALGLGTWRGASAAAGAI